jgi:NDP-4-keto-2,6-dideoxyhexose 3-C-methyltransferase
MYHAIEGCRICGNRELVTILDLGKQALTGVFPKSKVHHVGEMPLELVKCHGELDSVCHLVQLRHSVEDMSTLYGHSYGYRSGLNRTIVDHLHAKVKKILSRVTVAEGDLVIDIGSNDGTLLHAYHSGPDLVGLDPTGVKFKNYYPAHATLVPDFFSSASVKRLFGSRKAKVVTSIAMFYDLEDPIDFMKQVAEVLDSDGIWETEQSYMPAMLAMNSYDTICHEHLEYYGLHQIQWMAGKAGLKIVDVEINDINGGSFSVQLARKESKHAESTALIEKFLAEEEALGLRTLRPYREFGLRIEQTKEKLIKFLQSVPAGKVLGYGASTKGNVLLQYCGLTEREIPAIAEVNEDKFGAFTPGTHIPIVSEQDAKEMNPDYFLVLPWHFKRNILEREKAFLQSGGKLVFPLPELEII